MTTSDAPKRRGRPPKADALTSAQRSQRYRDKLKALKAERADPETPLSSSVIDLSALPPWRRK